MRTLLTLLPALACGAMMLVCARMMFGHKRATTATASEKEIEELREEVARLRAGQTVDDRSERISG